MNNVLSFIDENGLFVEAHGGCFLLHNGTYYWYGEDRRGDAYVHCYSSKDLLNWEDKGSVISTSTFQEQKLEGYELGLVNEFGHKVNLERPKVVYNKLSKMFVMYMHYENGENYDVAALAVAVSSCPDKDFVYLGHTRPLGNMSRDCTLFVDEDDKAYFISASNNNFDLHIYALSSDYLKVTSLVNKLFIGKSREAPALIKKDGVYYLFSSFCTGWMPNQCMLSFSNSLSDGWSKLQPIGDQITYHSQPGFLFAYKNKFYYMGDVWGGFEWKSIKEFDYSKSTYLCLELHLEKDLSTFIMAKNKKDK